MIPESQHTVGVVGLWHLGSVLCATWSRLGHRVVGVDADKARISALARGAAPLYEPGLDDALAAGLRAGTLTFSSDVGALCEAEFIFLGYDTPVLPDDRSDLTLLENALEGILKHARGDTIIIVSSQVPAGTCRAWRERIQTAHPGVEIVYSPENLRLGEALQCYARPGHVVIGADSESATARVSRLFTPMQADLLCMDLTSAELVKHGINAFLATSITFANQLADVCDRARGSFAHVARAMRTDPRIGAKAYLDAGLGFSGGTLGRDLRVLSEWNERAGNVSPLFGQVWQYNARRVEVVAAKLKSAIGLIEGKTIGVLGLTYKPGTSTLRRSLPLAVVEDLIARGARVQAYDPRADWAEVRVPHGLVLASDVQGACRDADAVVLLTEWQEFRDVDLALLLSKMRGKVLFDTRGIWRERVDRDVPWCTYLAIG